MDDEYDCIILGTGLKECILSGVLSCEGKKVLHMDRNGYYGGDSASLTLEQLYEKYEKGTPPASLGSSRDYNVDLVPKFVMASGLLVQILVKTDVTRYLEFKSVDGSYCVHNGKAHKVPATAGEALKSSLMGMLEKRRCGKFIEYIGNYEDADPKTHKGYNVDKMTGRELYKEFGLKPDTIDFLGHAMALYPTEDYMDKPCRTMMDRIRLYGESVMRYGNSPYIYPLYGLGEMPQGFARLSAIYGGTYMLNKPIEEIVYEGGKVVGVKSEGETARAKFVVGDPSYFPDKVKKSGQVARCICILSHPVKNTNDNESGQIVIPQREAKRGFDVYVSFVSAAHHVAPAGKYIAMVSTTVEGSGTPEEELAAGLRVLEPIDEKFISVDNVFEPTADGTEDQVFITKSFDPESHFGTTCGDILDVYKRITGKDMDLTPPTADDNADGKTEQ
jgi:Rab GDP dissociation inhibitor